MKTRKTVGFISALTMLASLMAMPVSAANVNVYSISYETLAESIETSDGSIVPAGAVAVTMSIDGNTGFDFNTLTIQIDDDCNILTDTMNQPILETGEVLNGFHVAVDENQNKICVATASSFETRQDGDLFTIYVNSTEAENIAEIKTEAPAASINTLVSGRVGDVNNNGVINSQDAAAIYTAVSNNGSAIVYSALSNITYLHSLFPNAPERQAVNCINSANWVQIYNQTGVDPRVVDSNDGDEILVYAAHHGSGSFYSGSVGSEFVAEI